ncbi:hypothetical protein BofuT4_P057620.1 [Botrytis cinerea T4]|uniref:Uncharacterized protein n=1 Tax=Botryotinia fuckeliana (strain T4) TaxID=999810 RepID=G2XUL2_BOTF4|nr:hypothetical protein BofuT4_P057620.1 [Botrytis cinerea T4]
MEKPLTRDKKLFVVDIHIYYDSTILHNNHTPRILHD